MNIVPVIALLLAPAAPNLEDAKTYFHAGKQAYAAGEYLSAARAFQTAYDAAPKPLILYSMAQALRLQYAIDAKAKHLFRARQLYQLYLKNDPRGSRRQDALLHIQSIDSLVARLPRSERRRLAQAVPDARQETPTQIMISSQTEGAVATLDGGAAKAVPIIQEVPPGKHRVKVEGPGYFPKTIEAVAVAGRLVVAEVNLDPRPAELSVTGANGAELRLDGRFAGELPLSESIELSSGKHFLEVSRNGHYPFAQELHLGRGESRTVTTELKPTNQRQLSYYLMAAGAVGLAAGAGGWTWSAITHGQVNTLENTRNARSLSEAERDRYNDLLDREGRLRTWGTIGVGTAVVLGGIGALLYLIDRPQPQTPGGFRSGLSASGVSASW